MRLVYIFIGFILLLIRNSCVAQQFNVKTYSFAEGLSTYNIKKAVQDKYGFIWLATQDGVYRFDGTNFESYKKSSNESTSLRENFIFDIAPGNDENLYIASFNGGIDVINIRTSEVTHLLSEKKGKEEGLPDLWITRIFCDASNNLWIGGKDYIKVYDLKEKKYKDFQQSATIRSENHITFIRAVNKNTIAIGAENYGILFYNTTSLNILDSIRTLENKNNITVSDLAVINDSCYISAGPHIYSGKFNIDRWQNGRKISIPTVSNNIINCLVKGKQNELWLGTNNGMGKFDLASNQFKSVDNNEFFSADNFIYDLFVDKDNGLWISSSKNLVRMNLIPSPFYAIKGSKDGLTRMNHIYSVIPINKTHLFACGTDGLYLIDLVSENVKKIRGTASLGIIHYVHKMNDDLWLVSSDAGMYAYQPSKEFLSKDLVIQLFPEWLPFINNYFNNTVKLGNKTYWASEEQEGLLIWDTVKHAIKQYRAGTEFSHGVPENHMHNIKFDKDGFIWMLFDNSVARFDPIADSVDKILKYERNGSGFNAGIFFDMFDDGSVLWFGTYGGGINGYNKKTAEWSYITEEDGLCNNAVYGIIPERDSIFWVSTNNGLSRVNYKTHKCLNHYTDDGLQDNSFDEQGALLFDKKMFFAGVNGFTKVDLDNYNSISTTFPVYIKRIEYVKGNKKIILNDLEWGKVELPAGTSAVTIWLSGLSFTSNRPRFSYKIKGFQDEYLPAGDKNKIELNALNYGNYKIDIRYINEKGEFVEGVIGVNLEILPFWYQTWWFRVLIVAVALSIIIIIVRLIYVSRLRKHRVILEKQIAVQLERQRISSEMHDDIGAGLSGIKLLTEMTKGKVKDTEASREVEKIYESVGDISAKMKEVIWSLNTENDQLSSLVSYIQRQARQWLENYPCELTIAIPEKIPEVTISGETRRNIFLIIKEAVHNIIKHSGATKVNINIACEQQLIISVSDNGKGMDVCGSNTMGNGLKNMEHRINQLNGKIFIQNGEGVNLTFKIPYK